MGGGRKVSTGVQVSGHLCLSGQRATAPESPFLAGIGWPAACTAGAVGTNVALLVVAWRRGGRGVGGTYFLRRSGPRGLAALALVLVTLAGCRSSLELCADGCGGAGSSPPVDATTGGAGRDSTESDAAAGEAGTSAVDCATDDDCADDLRCNGDERCEAGACREGVPLMCDAGTVCDETDPQELCAFAVRSPWLLLVGYEKVWGLPTAELGKRELMTLGERASTDLFVGLDTIEFSPSGRHAFITFMAPDFGEELLELGFSRGIPAPLHDVSNLPNWGTYSDPVFSPDGARALVSEYDSGVYLLDLSGSSARPSALNVATFNAYDVAFCSDSRTWLRKGPQTTLYVPTDDGEPLANDLAHYDDYDVELSADARKIWLGGEDPRLVACSADATARALGTVADDASFSPDSRWLLLSLADGSATVSSVAESLETAEVWAGLDVVSWVWSPDGNAIALKMSSDEGASYGYLDLTQAEPVLHPFALDGRADLLGCGTRGCLAQIPEELDPARPLFFQRFDRGVKPLRLGDDLAPLSVALADFEHDRLVLQRSQSQGNELTLTDFQGAPERHLFDWARGSVVVHPASDDSGVEIGVRDEIEISNFWVTFPKTAKDAPNVVSLDAPGAKVLFQPWP